MLAHYGPTSAPAVTRSAAGVIGAIGGRRASAASSAAARGVGTGRHRRRASAARSLVGSVLAEVLQPSVLRVRQLGGPGYAVRARSTPSPVRSFLPPLGSPDWKYTAAPLKYRFLLSATGPGNAGPTTTGLRLSAARLLDGHKPEPRPARMRPGALPRGRILIFSGAGTTPASQGKLRRLAPSEAWALVFAGSSPAIGPERLPRPSAPPPRPNRRGTTTHLADIDRPLAAAGDIALQS